MNLLLRPKSKQKDLTSGNFLQEKETSPAFCVQCPIIKHHLPYTLYYIVEQISFENY